MKILKFEAENFKRLVVAEITPTGSIVELTGKNGQGKTSTLDAILVALGGASLSPMVPIRDGASEARIRLTLGGREVELIVTRTYKVATGDPKGYTTSLKVEGNVGGMTPQAMLDSLLSVLTFDPMEFMRMDMAKQYETFASMIPGVDFAGIKAANAIAFSERTEWNRKLKQIQAAANKIEVPANAALVRVDEAALIQQLATAAETNAGIMARQKNRDQYAADIKAAMDEIEKLRARIVELETAAAEKRAKLDAAPPLPAMVDTADVQRQIEAAKIANAQVEQRELKEKYIKMAAEAQAESDVLTKAIDERNAHKNKQIAASKISVAGITFADDSILYKGVPLSQASDAEQIRISTAIAIAKNPTLRILRIRQGSLIDSDGMKLLATIAQENDFQIWIERVDDSGKIGFVFEDGHVRDSAPAAMQQQPLIEQPVPAATGAFPYGTKTPAPVASGVGAQIPMDIL